MAMGLPVEKLRKLLPAHDAGLASELPVELAEQIGLGIQGKELRHLRLSEHTMVFATSR